MSTSENIRTMLFGTNMSIGDIARVLGITYQAVYRVAKDLPRPREQMQAAFKAAGGTIDATALTATTRRDSHPRQPKEYREYRHQIYEELAKVTGGFGGVMQGVLRGESMLEIMTRLSSSAERVTNLEERILDGWALRLGREDDFKRELSPQFRNDVEAHLYKELGWLKSSIDGILPVLRYPDMADKGRQLLEARLPQLKQNLRDVLKALEGVEK